MNRRKRGNAWIDLALAAVFESLMHKPEHAFRYGAELEPEEPMPDDWFVKQEKIGVSQHPDRSAGQARVDLVRWRLVRQTLLQGLRYNQAYAAASDYLSVRGRPYAGSPRAMKWSHDKIQRIRKGEAAKSRTTKSS
jgi:hypothetical protein